MQNSGQTTTLVSALGLAAALWLVSGTVTISRAGGSLRPVAAETPSFRLLAVGDINLGRVVGQKILQGDTLFPFAFVRDQLATYDLVIGNLESPLSDQNGETQHPRNNLVFTGPPGGARALRRGGITLVSTANNHALDYGVRGLTETMANLRHAGVRYAGTSLEDSLLFQPVLLDVQGMTIAFFACTDVMNMEDPVWKRYVASADTARLLPLIREYNQKSDLMILSYHGGNEYGSQPSGKTRWFARTCVREGIDLFLGHHPHVPQGVEEENGRYIVYSLGNFVFRQPFAFWTQRSFAFTATITKGGQGATIADVGLLPLRAGLQPEFLDEGAEAAVVLNRIDSLSRLGNVEVAWR
jgi:poly-gamma-glutamate capsule biosynthesis protein CapA/YwtB (metallophosphatase superfamily)